MVYVQPWICPGEWDAQTPQGFWNTNGLPNLRQTTMPYHHHLVVSCSTDIPDPLSPLHPYRSSLPAGPQGYTSYPHTAAVCRCELVALTLLGHVKGSIGVRRLWARPYFSSSVLHVLVRLTLIVFVMGSRWPYNCCFVGCCLQDLFNTARSILV